MTAVCIDSISVPVLPVTNVGIIVDVGPVPSKSLLTVANTRKRISFWMMVQPVHDLVRDHTHKDTARVKKPHEVKKMLRAKHLANPDLRWDDLQARWERMLRLWVLLRYVWQLELIQLSSLIEFSALRNRRLEIDSVEVSGIPGLLDRLR